VPTSQKATLGLL